MRVIIHKAPEGVLDETLLQRLADNFCCKTWRLIGPGALPKLTETDENDLCVTRLDFSRTLDEINPEHRVKAILTWDEAVAELTDFPTAESGAQREKLAVAPYDLVPFQEIADAYTRVAEFGAQKYKPWNWSAGLSRVQLIGSLLRHTFAYLRGQERDDGPKGSGLLHTDHILWNAVALSHNVHWNLADGRRPEPDREYKAVALDSHST